MKITVEKIQALNPCSSRYQNFIQNYPKFSGSAEDFLSLEKITYSDKVWVCVRLMTQNQKFYWARATAYSVLEIFESRRPNDNRVRELLDYMNTLDDVTALTSKQRDRLRQLCSAATAAAYAATSAAYAAATAAACAATPAADAAAAYAADAAAAYAADAAAAYAADAAGHAAYAAARTEQEEFNLIILAQIMEMDI